MIKYRLEHLMYALRFLDAGVIVFSYVTPYFIMAVFGPHIYASEFKLMTYNHIWLLLMSISIWLVTLNSFHFYNSFLDKTYFNILRLSKSCIISTSIIFLVLELSTPNIHDIVFTSAFCLLTSSLLFIERHLFDIFLLRREKKNQFCRNIAIIGTGFSARYYSDQLSAHPQWGIKLCGYIEDLRGLSDDQDLNGEMLGKINELPFILENNPIDEVVVAMDLHQSHSLGFIINTCEEIGVDVALAPLPLGADSSKVYYTAFPKMPLMVLSTTPLHNFQIIVKNIIDFSAALTLLTLLSPIMLLIAALIKVNSQGPIFYSQIRCGLNGRRFKMHKFRSMYVDADQRLNELLTQNQHDGPVFKMKNDPRVTGVGYWLRKLSLDELPQLINVLQGTMSLIGPRPPLPHEVFSYKSSQRRRLSVVPGITGLWQVSGRSDIDFQKWIELDLYYIDNWSLWLDFKIFLKTIPVVLQGKGAY